MSKTIRFLLAAGLVLGLTPAFAQTAPPKPDITKQFGDWLVRCYPVSSPSPCDMYELLAQKDTGNRVMSMSFAYAPKQDRYVVQIAVPLGVALKTGLTIKAADYVSPVMQFRRCDRGGCYVEGVTDSALLSALAQQSGDAKATIASDDGRSLDVNFSLKGFGEARSAMAELAKQRATEPKPAPADEQGSKD
ncbi:MAG TPA: invasion associated locus B family protein [Rhizomicrobium sp.]|nr:invasion associated locus B family protein [Rhizomicrobium sp.]